jgi:hypothetical protein
MAKLIEMLKHWMTARDGQSYSLTKLVVGTAAAAMVYKFCQSPTPDYIGFAGGISALAAALAAKYYVETPEKANEPAA